MSYTNIKRNYNILLTFVQAKKGIKSLLPTVTMQQNSELISGRAKTV